jgi:hypothetical protein
VRTDRLCVLAATTNALDVKLEGASARLILSRTSRQIASRFALTSVGSLIQSALTMLFLSRLHSHSRATRMWTVADSPHAAPQHFTGYFRHEHRTGDSVERTCAKRVGFLLVISILLAVPRAATAQGSGYARERAVIINHFQVANADQSNFPVLISGAFPDLATVGNGGNVQSAQGYDIIFASDAAGQNLLAFEQESYSASTGSINYWVKVPTVSHTTDTIIYMFYGNASVTTDQSNKTAVWDTSYKGVWHLANGVTLNANDSTSNANSGTVSGNITAATGKIDGAATSPGTTGNTIATSNSITGDTSPFTYSFWLNSVAGGTVIHRGQDGFGNGWSVFVDVVGSNIQFSIVNSSATQITITSNATIASGTWYYVTAVWTPGSTLQLYVNGALDSAIANTSTTLRSSTKGVQFLSGFNSLLYFNGILDQVEISNIARSANWIATEYNNQSSPSSFAAACPSQSPGSSFSNCLHPSPTTYSYVRAITFNHAKVVNTDEQNFPVLISGTYPDLANVANGGTVQSLQGYDIMFASDAAGQNLLSFERETYSPSTGSINYWVKVPTLSHTTDTSIYMFYGNASVAADQSNKTAVWDANYKGVWHLANGVTLNATDSTSHANDGTVNGSISATAGKLDGAATSPGTTGNTIATSNAITGDTSPFTYSFWLNSVGSGTVARRGQDGFGNGWSALVQLTGSNMQFAIVNSTPTQFTITSNATIAAGTWYYVTAVWTPGSTLQLYVNGALDSAIANTSTTLRSSTKGVQFLNGFNGILDEVEISNTARSANWIATEYNNQSSPSSFAAACPSQSPGSSFSNCLHPSPTTYSYVRAITFNHAKVVNTDEQNFPVLISGTYPDLANVANGGSVQSLQGYDIVFTSDSAGQNLLDHEIDTYNATTGTANFWVRIPSLSHSTDTTVYMWYGNAGIAISQENKQGVWSNSYAAVYHFGNGSSVTASDSTGINSGTLTSVSAASGTIGGGGSFGGSSSLTAIPANAVSGSFTIEEWANPSTTSGKLGLYGSRLPSDFGFDAKLMSAGVTGDIGNGTAWIAAPVSASFPFSANTWHHYAYTVTTTGFHTYADGTQIGAGAYSGTPLLLNSTHNLLIGKTGFSGEGFSGSIDEARVSTVVRSADWIATEYNNQSSPATFAVPCQGQTVGNSVPPCPLRLPANTYTYTRAITINHVAVPNTDQQNFPVLISGTYADLANVANGGKVQNVQGYDIVFTSDAAGQIFLDHEIDTYNSATGAVNLWVRIPVLSHTADTTIYMWFGNSSATFSQENKPGVWSNGYAAVYHMGNGTAISGGDSSGSNPGTVTNVSATAGVIGGGGSFTGSSSITAIPSSSLSGSFTIEEWANPNTISGALGLYGSRTPSDQSFSAKLYSSGIYEDIGNGSSWLATSANVSFPYSANLWHFFAHTATTNAYQVYADGIPIGSGAFSGTPLLLDANHDLLIGKTGLSGEGFSGLIDEARVSKVVRSADWIATEYNNQNSPGTFFTIAGETPAVVFPQITNVSPAIVGPGVSMTITGTSFGASQQSGAVVLNNSIGTVVSWNNTQIVVTIPSGTSAGKLYVRQNAVNSNAVAFTIANPQIISISPTSGVVGTQITITGTGFGPTAGTATVNGTNATVQSWNDAQVVATVAPGTTTGGVRIVNAGVTSNAVTFSMPNPQITNISPTVGTIGTQITITGTGFGATSGTASVNGMNATIQSWSDTQVVASVATGTTSGGVQVVNGGVSSNAVTFTILNPQIAAINPASGAIGTQITITGTGFGSSTGTVSVNGTNATVQSWSDTQVVATIAAGTTTGGVRVFISGVSSNAITFTVTSAGPQLNTSRYGHSATTLNSGKVLVAGGINCASAGSCTYLNSAEIYDPSTGIFTNTGSMLPARSAPAILLGNGKVLITGGYSCDSGGNCASLNGAEIYDPTTGTFSNAGTMTVDRYAHTMTLLNNGKVLIAGGESCTSSTTCSALQTAELYDPVSGTFSATGSLNAARFNAAAVALTSGQVLIAGGFDGTNFPANAELFDPVAGTFTATGALNTPRALATATLLDNGSVVIAGGSTCSLTNCPTATAELYASGAFSTISNLSVSRVDQTATLLTNGQLLMAGGYTACGSSCVSDSTTELFDPQASSFAPGQGLSAARSQHTATLLNDGSVLLVGGINNGQSLGSTDIYHPSNLALPRLDSITITPPNSTIAPGATQPLTAMGFDSGANLLGTLQSVIWSSSAPSVATVTNGTGSAGIVSSLTPGTTTITATVGGIIGSTQVSVAANPPNISSISPSSGSVGTSVTITGANFGSAQGGSTLTFNGVVATPTTWAATSIIVRVPVGATTGDVVINTAGVASNPVIFNVTPPPIISSVSPNTGGIGTTVILSGSYFGEMQQSSTATFNGVPATVASWNDASITIAVPAGLSAGVKNLTVQVAGLASNSISFTVTQPLFITPSQMGMLVGDTLQLQLLDENGVELTDVSWSIDNTSVADINPPQGTGDPTVLQANETGTANILATSGNRTGTAKVTVYEGTVLPVGSIRWAVPPLAGGINNTVQATRVDANTPDFYASDGGTFIRALSSTGRQKWVWPAPGVARYPFLLTADDQGGAIYFASNDAENQFQGWCYVGRVDQNGHESWQYQETNCLEDYAIGADGTIFLMEDDFQNQGWDQVTALDPKTGNIKFGVPLPADTPSATALNFSYIAGKPDNPPNTYDPYCTPGTTANIYTMPGGSGGPPYDAPMKHGGLTVSSDGKVYLPIATVGDLTLDAGGCDPGSDPDYPLPIDRSKATQTVSESLKLLVISPDGSSSIQQVDNQTVATVNWNSPQYLTPSFRFDNSQASGRAIPDGNGGVFIAGYQSLYHGNSSGFTYSTVPIIISQCFGREYTCDPLLLGEDGTVYLNGYSSPRGPIDTATAVDPTSGSTKWTWQSTGVNLNTVMANGTIAVQSQNSLQLIDPSGQATPALSTTLVGNDATYYANGFWSSTLPDRSLGLIAGGDPLYVASTERPQKKGGGAKKNRPTPPEIVNYLPSFIEGSVSDPLRTQTFPSTMDGTVFNVSAPSPSANGIPVNQHYNIRSAAIVQTFRADLSKPHDAVAFIGHNANASFDNGGGLKNFSYGLNFYYPLSPGKNPGDVSSWDINYLCAPVGDCYPPSEPLLSECPPPTLSEACNGPNAPPPTNKLLPLQKDVTTVVGFPQRMYGNDYVATSDTPGPPHRPILLVDKLAVNAKVIFAGACYLIPEGQLLTNGQVPIFLQMWDIHDANFDREETRDRAMILPTAGTEAKLEDAARQWINIVKDMVNNKKTVQQAVDHVNANDTIQQFVVYGNHNVKLTTATASQ